MLYWYMKSDAILHGNIDAWIMTLRLFDKINISTDVYNVDDDALAYLCLQLAYTLCMEFLCEHNIYEYLLHLSWWAPLDYSAQDLANITSILSHAWVVYVQSFWKHLSPVVDTGPIILDFKIHRKNSGNKSIMWSFKMSSMDVECGSLLITKMNILLYGRTMVGEPILTSAEAGPCL